MKIAHYSPFSFLLVLYAVLSPGTALACQPCVAYQATDLHGFSERRTTVGLSEVFTKYQSTSGVRRVRSGEILQSYSTTELSLNYDFTKRIGVQVSVPVIRRDFFEFQDFRRRENDDSGIGDASVLLQYAPVIHGTLDTTFYWSVNAGIKLPTGDSGSLREVEDRELVNRNFDPRLAHHVGGAGGIQGRTSSLGTGSFDVPFGTKLFLRYKRVFIFGSFQYTIRTEGDFDYDFADDFVWNIGPAVYLYLGDHDFSVALRAAFSGEDKSNDSQNGAVVPQTAIANVYAGPELLVTILGRYTTEIAVDIPIATETNDALQEPSYRLRAAIGYRF